MSKIADAITVATWISGWAVDAPVEGKRHVAIIIARLGLAEAKAVSSPGEEDPQNLANECYHCTRVESISDAMSGSHGRIIQLYYRPENQDNSFHSQEF